MVGKGVAQTCEWSFLSHFGRRSLSPQFDGIAIISLSCPRGNLNGSLFLWICLSCWGNLLSFGWDASVLVILQKLTWCRLWVVWITVNELLSTVVYFMKSLVTKPKSSSTVLQRVTSSHSTLPVYSAAQAWRKVSSKTLSENSEVCSAFAFSPHFFCDCICGLTLFQNIAALSTYDESSNNDVK